MNKEEAGEILDGEVERLRSLGYDQLRVYALDGHLVTGRSGITYNVEIQVWDDDPKRPDGNLRVIVSIDDGRGFRAFVPLSADFIIAPDGSFVGEE